ncbi:hypothetical protein N7475_001076 [Penicillium sp. IBT 31633x]|nr:hypothetical protein N7475_001076 [Penicillium sp. IBT 31633x]
MDTLRPTNSDWTVEHHPRALQTPYSKWMAHWGLPVEAQEIPNPQSVYRDVDIVYVDRAVYTCWTGLIGPSVVFLTDIQRAKNSNHPFISEFTKAVYEKDYPLDGLKYIFVANVVNHDTLAFIDQHIYHAGVDRRPIRTYNISHPEFLALLGTRIGKTIGYFILGTYGQGVKRIKEICLFTEQVDAVDFVQLLFVLEDIDPKAIESPTKPMQQKQKLAQQKKEKKKPSHRVQKVSGEGWRRSSRLKEKYEREQEKKQKGEEQNQGQEKET